MDSARQSMTQGVACHCQSATVTIVKNPAASQGRATSCKNFSTCNRPPSHTKLRRKISLVHRSIQDGSTDLKHIKGMMGRHRYRASTTWLDLDSIDSNSLRHVVVPLCVVAGRGVDVRSGSARGSSCRSVARSFARR